MLLVALVWQWPRWAGVTRAAFSGPFRIGEGLRGRRANLVLPRDLLDVSSPAFFRIDRPKSRSRRGPRVQHVAFRDAGVIAFLDEMFGELRDDEPLYPGSPAQYRRRWDKILAHLGIPATLRLTPGCLRPGGAVAAYRQGTPLPELQWRMRLKHLMTLEHYLQEVAASTVLRGLAPATRARLQTYADLFDRL